MINIEKLVHCRPWPIPSLRTADVTSLQRPARAGLTHCPFFDRALVSNEYFDSLTPTLSQSKREQWS